MKSQMIKKNKHEKMFENGLCLFIFAYYGTIKMFLNTKNANNSNYQTIKKIICFKTQCDN